MIERTIRSGTVSDPPTLASDDVERIDAESRRLSDAFRDRTRGMEVLTSTDLRTAVR